MHFSTRLAVRIAPLMFTVAVMFLACQAVLIVLWVDVPSLRENALQANESLELADESLELALRGPVSANQLMIERLAVVSMLLIWPIVIAESLFHVFTRPWNRSTFWYHFYSGLYCVCPSLRMGARSAEMHGRLWLPVLQWQRPNRRLRRRLEQHFSVPMIGIALLILPVLIVEFLLKDQVARYQWLRVALHAGTGVIWFAFAAEFILMLSIAEKKFDYIRRHWVDAAIIALPFFSFLRSMQAVRGTRLAKLAKVPQLTKLARAYRLRGTALKAFRALVLLDVSARVFRTTPEKQLVRLREELIATQREVRLLRLLIARLENETQQGEQPLEKDRAQDSAAES